MDEVIARATDLINQLLKSAPTWYLNKNERTKLIHTRNLLNRLAEPNPSTKKWTGLFYRQLDRLMDYNESLSKYFWNELHDDIYYVIEGPNNKQSMDIKSNDFLRRIKLEEKLEQRDLQFQESFKERKSFNQLFSEHKEFFKEYLHKCISLHSKVEVRSLVDNVDDLLCKTVKFTNDSFTPESRERINEKLKCIEIPLDCSYRSLEDIHNQLFATANAYQRVNDSLSKFLPSVEPRFEHHRHNSKTFEEILQLDRWIVILGEPGSAKTSLLRWITRIFAEAVHDGSKEIIFKRDHSELLYIPVRIPILIQIGEFAKWFEQHQTKTLIDYIGKQTWFSQPYIHDYNGNVLKELIKHGHALILLDGLDEIPEVGRRRKIVKLVRKFIHKHVKAADFFSAFDDRIFDTSSQLLHRKVIETQPPSKSGGNQIIITSRIVGYQLHPLSGSFIQHYSLLLMDYNEAKIFTNKWMTQVEKNVFEILSDERIKLDEEMVKNLSKRRYNTMEVMFEKSPQFLISNPSLLSLICTLIFQSPDEFYPKSRAELYHHAVQSALRSWTNHEPSISKDWLTHFLINLATYLHLESPSGLVDTFDMKKLCYSTLKQLEVTNDPIKLREHANKLISTLESNIGIVSERGLEVFGFQHLSFQEYFVSQSFVQTSSKEQVVKLILSFAINPRFRESLLLALAWISWKWSCNDYDNFCNLLVTPNKDYAFPLGALLYLDALDDIPALPSKSIIFLALNSILDLPSNIIANTCFISNLSKLPENIVTEWMQLYLINDERLLKFCQCLRMKCDRLGRICQNNLKTKGEKAEFLIAQIALIGS